MVQSDLRGEDAATAAGGQDGQWLQGLTLVHFSAQLESFLTHNPPYTPLNIP
jgi:hypothetical protein